MVISIVYEYIYQLSRFLLYEYAQPLDNMM